MFFLSHYFTNVWEKFCHHETQWHNGKSVEVERVSGKIYSFTLPSAFANYRYIFLFSRFLTRMWQGTFMRIIVFCDNRSINRFRESLITHGQRELQDERQLFFVLKKKKVQLLFIKKKELFRWKYLNQ